MRGLVCSGQPKKSWISSISDRGRGSETSPNDVVGCDEFSQLGSICSCAAPCSLTFLRAQIVTKLDISKRTEKRFSARNKSSNRTHPGHLV